MAAIGAYQNNSVNSAVLVSADYTRVSLLSVVHANTPDCWLQMFDASSLSDVTIGTTAPDWSWPVPGATSATKRGILNLPLPEDAALRFPNGLVIALTTAPKGGTGITLKGVVNLVKR